MTVVVLPVHPGGGIVQLLPGTAGQPRLVHPILLGVELTLVFDQQVGDLPSRDLDPHLAKPFQDLRLGHLTGKSKDDDHGPHPGPKFPLVARGQLRQVGLPLAGRVEFLFPEEDVVGTNHHVLHHHFLVSLELSIWRQDGWVDL